MADTPSRSDNWRVIQGDCVTVMRGMDAESIDAVVCDPPYGLEFMGKDWDRLGGARIRKPSERDLQPGAAHNASTMLASRNLPDAYVAGHRMQAWHEAWAGEALRVLKPGGHLLAFGGTRTYHRLACAVEDAGFEIRDAICWLYGSGFPKSLDVSKAIDKAAGVEREPDEHDMADGFVGNTPFHAGLGRTIVRRGEPATPEAADWSGWGTALKPAHEPIVVARKPLSGTVAANVLEHGTGALNVDGCRIEGVKPQVTQGVNSNPTSFQVAKERRMSGDANEGRWPANVVLDGEAAAMLDAQTGELTSGKLDRSGIVAENGIYGAAPKVREGIYEQDSGGASRFFYCAKSSSAERNAGLDAFEAAITDDGRDTPIDNPYLRGETTRRNVHPTVKPIDLMRWLVRLVTPPGGTVADPFTGSGTTGCAATLEGFQFIGIEREAEYAEIARARIAWWAKHPQGVEIVAALEAEAKRKAVADTGQLGLLD